MPIVQLSRLRSQINSLLAHFNNADEFRDSLTSLFRLYENKETSTNIWFKKSIQSISYNVPESVMTELCAKISILSVTKPEFALVNADMLWEMPYYENKRIAIVLISNLGPAYQDNFLQRIHSWISVDLEDNLTRDLFSVVEEKPSILQSSSWLDLIKSWIDSHDINLIRLALQALNRTVSHKYQNLPAIFSLLTPLVCKPQISIQKELKNVIQTLVELSEAETASFLIMVGELFPEEEALKFIRKCIPLFDIFFQAEIRNALGF